MRGGGYKTIGDIIYFFTKYEVVHLAVVSENKQIYANLGSP